MAGSAITNFARNCTENKTSSILVFEYKKKSVRGLSKHLELSLVAHALVKYIKTLRLSLALSPAFVWPELYNLVILCSKSSFSFLRFSITCGL